MSKLHGFTGTDFYCTHPQSDSVPALCCEIRHGQQQGQSYSYLVFLDEQGIKWKIVPQLTHNRRIASLKLFHRNQFGRRGFHSQKREWGNKSGLRDLISSIANHESYERDRQ